MGLDKYAVKPGPAPNARGPAPDTIVQPFTLRHASRGLVVDTPSFNDMTQTPARLYENQDPIA